MKMNLGHSLSTSGVVSAFRGGTELSHKLGVGSGLARNNFRYIQTDAAITVSKVFVTEIQVYKTVYLLDCDGSVT